METIYPTATLQVYNVHVWGKSFFHNALKCVCQCRSACVENGLYWSFTFPAYLRWRYLTTKLYFSVQLGPSSALIRHDNGTFRKRSSKWRNLPSPVWNRRLFVFVRFFLSSFPETQIHSDCGDCCIFCITFENRTSPSLNNGYFTHSHGQQQAIGRIRPWQEYLEELEDAL